jgi:hypothetical protein
LQPLFVLSGEPVAIDPADPRWCAVLPEAKPCVWEGDYAILTGPVVAAEDDDHHLFRRGLPLEICSKTLHVVTHDAYRSFFAIYNRASRGVRGEETACSPTGGCC